MALPAHGGFPISGRLNDNFTVGLVSTGFLYSLRYFLGV